MTLGFPGMSRSRLKERGETQTRRCSSDLCFFLGVQRVADCSWKPHMWNHFSPSPQSSLCGRAPRETKPSSSLPLNALLLQVFAAGAVEMNCRWKLCPEICFKRKEIHGKILARSFCKAVKSLTGVLWNSAERVRGILLTLLWWEENMWVGTCQWGGDTFIMCTVITLQLLASEHNHKISRQHLTSLMPTGYYCRSLFKLQSFPQGRTEEYDGFEVRNNI